MIAMSVMEVTLLYEIRVVAMWHALHLLPLMVSVTTDWRALRRICIAHRQFVLVIVVAVLRMQMSFVEVICMALVLDARVAAALPMCMRMAFV